MARTGRISGLARAAIAAAMAGAAAGMIPAPALAQYSPGYQFLKAIEKGDGNEVVQLLQKHSNTLVESRDITSGESALHIAVKNMVSKGQDLLWVQFLLQHKANPNVRDNRGITPLMLASQNGLVDAVNALIGAGAQVDTGNATGETPLIAAVHRRDIAMMRVLLKGGANPDRADSSGRSARDYAALEGASSQLVNEIERNAKPRAQGQSTAIYGPSF